MSDKRSVVVIVGGGFGGLAAARALKHAPVNVVLIDRVNHHLFQPLLYQVATSVLAPGQIASPIRSILRKSRNTTLCSGQSQPSMLHPGGLPSNRRTVRRPISYDYLILATGQTHSYFGHNEYEKYAPGLKSLADAVAIRNKILTAFEMAEAEEDPTQHRDLLTFVLVGAGPTGVEMASAIAVMIESTLKRDFRRVDPRSARIVLVDAGQRPLGTFAPGLSRAALNRLRRLGVEVMLGKAVESIDGEGVIVAGERIASRTVIWTAGVAPSQAGKWLNAETDRAGRVKVRHDLSVADHPEVFVVGDTASLEQDGKPLPGVAQVAMQQGRYAGELIKRRATGKAVAPAVPLLRQRKSRRRRERLCGLGERQGSYERICRMAGLGCDSSAVSRSVKSSCQRICAMDLDLLHGPAWFAPHREPSRWLSSCEMTG